MRIYFPLDTLKALLKSGCKSEELNDPHIYRGREVDSRDVEPSDFSVIRKVLEGGDFLQAIENRRIIKKLDALEELRGAPAGKKSKALRMLELIPEAIRDIVGKTPHRWVFTSDDLYGAMLPWFVEEAEYHAAQRTSGGYTPARTEISLKAHCRGKVADRTIVLHKEDLVGSLGEILARHDAVIETPKLVADYEAELKYYSEHYSKTGEQYTGTGRARPAGSRRWSKSVVNLERDGRPVKLVMDDVDEDDEDQGREAATVQTDYWSKQTGSSDEKEEAFALPIQPIVRVFSLESHEYADAHITSLKPYVYDPSIKEKLILPEDHKSLIETLTRDSANRFEDIVRGKASGVIVLCSGLPGTGKTLTAEVYSEVVKRPLYAVQCAQLGTDEEELEKSLGEILDRAARWKAILLIDEADVYIHERGEDIHQNAIVGIFLRLLEYFKGVMFMTTNRPTVVDDAILSRVTAHVRYTPPSDDRAKRNLWAVLASQYGAHALDLDKAVKAFPGISGRSIRKLIYLSALTRDPKKITVETLRWAAKFHDFPELEGKENP